MDRISQAYEKAKMLVEEESASPALDPGRTSFTDDFNRQCTLSTQQRLYGFAICLVSGRTCTLLMLVFFHPIKFGITFTFGNLMALGSTAFLVGPKRQFNMMLDPVRIYATAIYIASMIVALFCALYVRNKLLTFLSVILEFGALIWYSLSYIPFARSMVSKITVSCFDQSFRTMSSRTKLRKKAGRENTYFWLCSKGTCLELFKWRLVNHFSAEIVHEIAMEL